MKNPERELHKYAEPSFDGDAKEIQEERQPFQQMWLQRSNTQRQKTEPKFLILQKSYSEWNVCYCKQSSSENPRTGFFEHLGGKRRSRTMALKVASRVNWLNQHLFPPISTHHLLSYLPQGRILEKPVARGGHVTQFQPIKHQ